MAHMNQEKSFLGVTDTPCYVEVFIPRPQHASEYATIAPTPNAIIAKLIRSFSAITITGRKVISQSTPLHPQQSRTATGLGPSPTAGHLESYV